MRFVMFYHSLLSDWNHGNAHFLRGVATELLARGHDVRIYEPLDSWSRANLVESHGLAAIREFYEAYPRLASTLYTMGELDLDEALWNADVVIVHEWNDHDLVRRIGEHRAAGGNYLLLFHDTHHRSVTDPESMACYDLRHYDGVLAFGNAVKELYVCRGWCTRAWTWHEAADTRVFRPMRSRRTNSGPNTPQSETDRVASGDLVWIGNWGDEERSAELQEFLIDPVRELGLQATIFGVRYPSQAKSALEKAGIRYGGWLPNYRVPLVLSKFRVTVHVPRRPYAQALPGIPTIRVFETLACGIPLVSAPWSDSEHLFAPGQDFLFARDGREMKRSLDRVLTDRTLAGSLGACGHRRILSRHTCGHRVEQLLGILQEIRPGQFDCGRSSPAQRSSHA